MPVDNRASRVLDHFLPVLDLKSLPVVTEHNLPDRIRRADAIVIADGQLEVNSLMKFWRQINQLLLNLSFGGKVKFL